MLKRVVVTGMAGISPIGNNWEQVSKKLKTQSTGIQRLDEWDKYIGLNTRLAAPADFIKPVHYSRKQTRSMGRIALMATYATELALIDAGLLNDPCLNSGQMGVAYGSSAGSLDALAEFGNMLLNHTVNGLNATSYIRMMAHTSAVNIGLFFGINGRIYTTSSACTSGSQGIGYAYEAIKHGYQKLMVAGGAEELSASEAAVFDTLFATSVRNDTPKKVQDHLIVIETAL